ncbi:Tat pathway signal protein [Streptomyces nigrescens]|uniref:Tat pathway signal protein n=1 Tax=Streptomyces nigrescens TaxID=1920 RepID=A0A640TSK4_STRNI|nr:Tat pathway signal protein [Streptomyces libani]WAU00035.1 Tat pathway signal protein [Streptomyces libani subsp. libani]GFE25752.1 Tat pathway signal protein [Streptomyces libani subsp. libani]GGV98943.1 Tat pathway signal protein [Streptomyces libani subsp. libani]
MAQKRNERLAAVIAESNWSHSQVALAVVRLGRENGVRECAAIGRSHVSKWVGGTRPSGQVPLILCEALSRRLGRVVTLDEVGLADPSSAPCGALDWRTDAVASLVDLGRVDVDLERRQLLVGSAYSVASLALPSQSWWSEMAEAPEGRAVRLGTRSVGMGDVEAVRETGAFFSRLDQRHGGGHGRKSLVQYLMTEVADYLDGRFPDDRVRREMFSAASELAYLAGWTAFDNAQHSVAQPYFTIAVKLAARADDPPMAGHVLRAMAHQALELGHPQQALGLASASVEGKRYRFASPREKALLGVVHARSLAATGARKAAAVALRRAEDDLAGAGPGIEEPNRTFFFSEASLAHETARTLQAAGDVAGALREFRRSVRTRNGAAFGRTHAVTLGLLGQVQAERGSIEEACATWSRALDSMDGIHSGRTRQTVVDMRRALSPYRRRGVRVVTELDSRAADFLSGVA